MDEQQHGQVHILIHVVVILVVRLVQLEDIGLEINVKLQPEFVERHIIIVYLQQAL